VFGLGSTIVVDLPFVAGTCVADALLMKYQVSSVTGTAAGNLLGCPAYTPFSRVEVSAGNQIIETILNYNLIQDMISHLTTSYDQRVGNQIAYGYSGTTQATDNAGGDMDGRRMVGTTETYDVSVPFNCILSNMSKNFPLDVAQIRLTFYIEPQMQNMFGYTATTTYTSFTISNFEIGYELIYHARDEHDAITSKNQFSLKSLTFASGTYAMGAGISGLQNMNFQIRNRFVKSLFFSTAPSGVSTGTQYINNQYDRIDCTNKLGTYQFILDPRGRSYPQKAMNVAINRANMLQELKKAATTLGVGYSKIFDKNNNMAITLKEFSWPCASGTVTLQSQPGKFFVGCHVERYYNQKNFVSGVDTRAAGIVANVVIPVATTVAMNALLVAVCDVIVDFDREAHTISVKA
jgi:hypothetical protein